MLQLIEITKDNLFSTSNSLLLLQDSRWVLLLKDYSFLLLGGTVLVIVILVYFLLRQRQKQKRLQARIEAMQAQINPHFISNSLNAIENLIHQDKKEDAAKYIIHFSRLSRQILNRSRSPFISLKDELRTLKHFLELEHLRFRDKLNFEIVVDPNLEQDLILLPALIFQPYVENAIWYGIKPKAGTSNLCIELKKDGKHLLAIIEDDGIGRKSSQQRKTAIAQQRKLSGMEISEERIQGMKKVKGAQVETIDLYSSSGAAAGTQVRVRLPLKFKK